MHRVTEGLDMGRSQAWQQHTGVGGHPARMMNLDARHPVKTGLPIHT